MEGKELKNAQSSEGANPLMDDAQAASNIEGDLEIKATEDVNIAADKTTVSDSVESTASSSTVKPKKKGMKLAIILAVVIMGLMLVGGGLYAAKEYHEKFAEQVEVERILPGGSDLVLEIVIDPESEQMKLMAEHIKKFPVYEVFNKLLSEELDKEDTTFSGAIKEDLADHGLNYEEDIKPILSDTAYFIVTDMDEISDGLGSNLISMMGDVEASNQKVQSPVKITQEAKNAKIFSRVLGWEGFRGEAIAGGESMVKGDDTEPLDMIFATNIKDLKKAKKTFDKIRESDDKQFEEMKYEGYLYYKQTAVLGENAQEGKVSIDDEIEDIYHALLGGNWVMATREDRIHSLIDKRRALHFTRSFMGNEDPEVGSMADDETFKSMDATFAQGAAGAFIQGYYKLKIRELLDSDEYSDMNLMDYFVYPDEVVRGFQVMFDSEGVRIKYAANDYDLSGVSQSEKFDSALAQMVPQKIDGRWVDVLVEYENPKELFYTFKEKSLTEEGAKEMDGVLQMMLRGQVDLEKDIIDRMDGNLGFVLAAGEGQEPIVSLMAQSSDVQGLSQLARNAVEMYKQQMIESLKMQATYMEGFTAQDMGCAVDDETCAALFQSSDDMLVQAKALEEVVLIEEVFDDGLHMFSFNVPDSEVSFDFGYLNDVFVISTHYAGVSEMLRAMSGDNTEKKLAQNDYYQVASNKLLRGGYVQSYIHMDGIYHAIKYYFGRLGAQELAGDEFTQIFEGVMANLRVMEIMGGVGSYEEPYILSDSYIKITALSQEEYDSAVNSLNAITQSMMGAKINAQKYSIKASMSSVVPAGIICMESVTIDIPSGEVVSGVGGEVLCSTDESMTWPSVEVCGNASGDAQWNVQNGSDAENWKITLECKEYTDCNGEANAVCTNTGCTFQGTCE